MSHNIKVEFASREHMLVELRELDRLALERRLDKDFPEWIDDAGTASDECLFRIVAQSRSIARWTVSEGQILAGRKYKAAALSAIIRMVGNQVSRSSTVGAQYSSIP